MEMGNNGGSTNTQTRDNTKQKTNCIVSGYIVSSGDEPETSDMATLKPVCMPSDHRRRQNFIQNLNSDNIT